jgi:integrase
MATFEPYKGPLGERFKAKIRRRGHKLSRTFGYKRDAEAWARKVEAAIDSATPTAPFIKDDWTETGPKGSTDTEIDPDELPVPQVGWTLRRALQHYEATVLPKQKGGDKALSRTKAWKLLDIASKRLNEITRGDVKLIIEGKQAAGKAANTVRNDVNILSGIYSVAIDQWELELVNPVRQKDLPEKPPARKARLRNTVRSDGTSDEQRLADALAAGLDGQQMLDIFYVALDTGARRSEIVKIVAGDIDTDHGTVYLTDTKNGENRTVVLTQRSVKILARRSKDFPAQRKVFSLSGDNVYYRLCVARVKAGLPKLRFHDLRHEGITRMVRKGLSLNALGAQSGHKTAAILRDYINDEVDEIREQLG